MNKKYFQLASGAIFLCGFILFIYNIKKEPAINEKYKEINKKKNVLMWLGILLMFLGVVGFISTLFLKRYFGQMPTEMYKHDADCNSCHKYIMARKNLVNPSKGNLEINEYYENSCQKCLEKIINDKFKTTNTGIQKYYLNKEYDYYHKGLNLATGELKRTRREYISQGKHEKVFPKVPESSFN